MEKLLDEKEFLSQTERAIVKQYLYKVKASEDGEKRKEVSIIHTGDIFYVSHFLNVSMVAWLHQIMG